MKTKIFWGNQYVTKFKCDGSKRTKWGQFKLGVVNTCVYTLRYSFFAFLLYIGFMAGMYASPTKTEAGTLPIVIESSPKILQKIAICESGGSHYNKAGQVLVVGNTDKSVDIGKYQINMKHWGAKATELGLNLFDAGDNYKMAKWIFENRGTQDWEASRSCWGK